MKNKKMKKNNRAILNNKEHRKGDKHEIIIK
jgi:hypothetical protein